MMKRFVIANCLACAAIALMIYGRFYVLPHIPWMPFDTFASTLLSLVFLAMANMVASIARAHHQ